MIGSRGNNLERASALAGEEDDHFHNKVLTIKHFNIFATLGTGTFGRVRQVKFKDDKKGRVYALKMLKKTELVNLNQVVHIKSEKAILKAINHPFIVSLYIRAYQDQKYVYMLLEYVPGGELFSRLRREGRFSIDVALFYSSEILLALQFIHMKNIVYRDLKPENLLIDNNGHIKLADFGFAKVLENGRTFTLCGTPEYLAPEIVKGSKRIGYGKSVDWWALGILLFEMLAGYPPFYDCEPTGIYKKITAGIIEFPRFFSLRTKDLIRKLLNPEIKYRLGCQEDGEEIKNHKWFRVVNFEDMLKRKIPAPWVPALRNEQDSQWFEEYPDSEQPARPLDREQNELFDGF